MANKHMVQHPWFGIDPVVVGAQIVNGLQTIVSRQSDLTKDPVVISTTIFNAGVRSNIIPEEVTLEEQSEHWIRLCKKMYGDVSNAQQNHIAEASGATVDVEITSKTLITYNDPKLCRANDAFFDESN